MNTKPFSWSYSSLNNFENCPKRFYHYSIAKDVVEPVGQQMGEGYQLHSAFDERIKSDVPLPLGMGHHEGIIKSIIEAPGKTYSERKLAITSSFTPTSFFADEAWYRGVLDCTKVNGANAWVFDWKTGKPRPDPTQMQLATALVFHSASYVQHVKTALVYVNYNKVEAEEYNRVDLAHIWAEIMPRVKKLQKAREENNYPPKPGFLCRKYCAVMECKYYGIGN